MKSKKYYVLLVIFLFSLILNSSIFAAPVKTINALYMKQAGYSESDIKSITQEFEKANPDVRINLTLVPYDALHDKIVTAAASRSGAYDVVLIDCIWTPEFARAGFITDVTNKISQTKKDDIFKGVLGSVSYKGKNYGMPWLNDTKYLFYNKKMLSEAGFTAPPKTWDELVKQAKEIKEKGLVKYPIIWSWAQAEAAICDYTALVSSFGGKILDSNDKPIFNKGAGLKALQFMVNTINEGISNPSSKEFVEEDVRRVFSQGNAAFALNWTYMYELANNPDESNIAGNAEISIVPGSDKAVSGSVNGGMGLAIVKGTKNPDAAWDYIKYMSSKNVQMKYSSNALPIYKSAYDNPMVLKGQEYLVKVAKQQYQYVANRPQVSWYPELSYVLQVEIQNALNGSKSPQEALNDAVKQVNDINK